MRGEGPILDTVSSLAGDPFFDLIEITHIADESTRAQVAAFLEQAHMEAHYGAQPILLANKLDLNHPDNAVRGKAVAAMKRAITEASTLGCRTFTVLSGPVSDDAEFAMGRLVNSLRELCGFSHSANLTLLLETFDQQPYGKNCLIGPTSKAVAVAQQIAEQYDNFGLVLDLSHLPLLGESAEEAIRTAAPYLRHVHIGNCAMDDPEHPAYGDEHPRFGAPGTRNNTKEVAEFIRALFSAGYLSSATSLVLLRVPGAPKRGCSSP